MIRISSVLAILVFSLGASAQKLTVQRAGDVGAVLLPFIGGGVTLFDAPQDGYLGFMRSTSAYTVSMAMTYALKFAVNRTRPNGEQYSFPSGHSTSAFSGATLIQLRWGWKAGIPAYLLASFVAYSRVYADKHYWSDVLAGAVIGSGLTYLVYKKWPSQWRLIQGSTDHGQTIGVQYRF